MAKCFSAQSLELACSVIYQLSGLGHQPLSASVSYLCQSVNTNGHGEVYSNQTHVKHVEQCLVPRKDLDRG